MGEADENENENEAEEEQIGTAPRDRTVEIHIKFYYPLSFIGALLNSGKTTHAHVRRGGHVEQHIFASSLVMAQ